MTCTSEERTVSEFSSNAAIYPPDLLACVELLVLDGIARGTFFTLSASCVFFLSGWPVS